MEHLPSPDESPLSAYPMFEGNDVEQARQALSNIYTEAFLYPRKGTSHFKMKINGVQLAKISVSLVQTKNAYVSGPVEPLDFHTVQLMPSGSCRFNIGNSPAYSTKEKGVMLTAGQKVKVHASDNNWCLGVVIKDTVLREALSALTGHANHDPIRFTPEFDLSQPRTASLVSLIHTLVRELDRPSGILEAPAAVASFEQLLITSCLFGLEHNLSETIRRPTTAAGTAQIRQVEQYLEANASQPIDMKILARETGHSIQSIYRAFRRHRDYTPMAFLRRVRMRAVREQLLRADPHNTVSGIALGCGFTHLGRFSVDYKRCFGESPSETLVRAVKVGARKIGTT